jgi:hypothetical protein
MTEFDKRCVSPWRMHGDREPLKGRAEYNSAIQQITNLHYEERFMESGFSPARMHWGHEPSGTTFGVLLFSWRRRRSPLSLRPPATVYQPFPG